MTLVWIVIVLLCVKKENKNDDYYKSAENCKYFMKYQPLVNLC